MPFLLFADDMNIANVAGISGGLATILGTTWVIVRQFFGDRAGRQSAEKKESEEAEKVKRVDTIAELEKMMNDLRIDFSDYKKEARALLANMEDELEEYRTKSNDCDRKTDRMNSHIFHLENILRKLAVKVEGIEFIPWVEVEAGTGVKAALKAAPTPTKEVK